MSDNSMSAELKNSLDRLATLKAELDGQAGNDKVTKRTWEKKFQDAARDVVTIYRNR
jgi:hypothetical protein